VSMYMYRDSKNDRMGIEVYNVLFYDTPADSKSQYRVVSSVLMDRALEMPKSMHLTLRSFEIEGTEYSVYSIDGHFYILCDGTKGSVDLFDGAYQATFDGDTFESKYLLIEGIRDGNPQVTLKEGQTVWPEWQGENKAEDLEGRIYLRINDTWTEASSQSKR